MIEIDYSCARSGKIFIKNSTNLLKKRYYAIFPVPLVQQTQNVKQSLYGANMPDDTTSTHTVADTAKADDSQMKKDKESEFTSVLLWLMKNGPLWARIPAIIATIAAALASPLVLLKSAFNDKPIMERSLQKREPSSAQLDMATSGKLSVDDKMVEEAFGRPNLPAEDRQKMVAVFKKIHHGLDHLSNPKDQLVPWTIFAKDSSNDYFGYKVFPSDKCLLIARVENGQGSSEWLADPNRPLNAPLPTQALPAPASPVNPGLPSEWNADGSSLKAYARREASYVLPGRVPADGRKDMSGVQLRIAGQVNITPVQGGCINPHPWNYSQAAGSPINACQTPVFRQWADGCSHVQVFDHCQNIWGPVVWQACAAFHHP